MTSKVNVALGASTGVARSVGSCIREGSSARPSGPTRDGAARTDACLRKHHAGKCNKHAGDKRLVGDIPNVLTQHSGCEIRVVEHSRGPLGRTSKRR